MYETTPDLSELDLTQARVDVRSLIDVARLAVEAIQ